MKPPSTSPAVSIAKVAALRIAGRLVLSTCGAFLVGLLLLISEPRTASAFEYAVDDSLKIMTDMIRQSYGKTICPVDHEKLADVGKDMLRYVAEHHPDRAKSFNNQDMYDGMVAVRPCPFSAERHGALPVTAAEQIVGIWSMARDSRVARIARPDPDPFPETCAWLGFYSDGDLQEATIGTAGISDASCEAFGFDPGVFENNRKALPKSISWRLAAGNALQVDRPLAHERWRAYVVDGPFDERKAHYARGDLLLFLEQYNDTSSEHRGMLYFRHFVRVTRP